MEILITNQQKKILLPPAAILKITRRILKSAGVRRGSLSLVFVTDDIIKKLNRRFLGRSYATDVLAFDLGEPTVTKKLRRSRTKRISLTGEIVISITTAFRQAKIYKTSPYEEVILYIVHGILHLLGYDDHASRDTRLMRKKEQELLAVIRPLLKKARR